MKSVQIIILIVCLIFSNAFAQDSTQNSLKQSKFALQFQIGSSFNIQSFQGTTLSCKYHIFDKSALRAGISLSSNIDTYREEDTVEKNGNESFSITFNAQFIQYLLTSDDVSLYTGGGPQYYRRFYNSETLSADENYWSLGISGLIGVEWFFKKNMSLSAEYGVVIYYKVEKGNYYSGTPYIVKSINTTDYNMLKFGLSVYI